MSGLNATRYRAGVRSTRAPRAAAAACDSACVASCALRSKVATGTSTAPLAAAASAPVSGRWATDAPFTHAPSVGFTPAPWARSPCAPAPQAPFTPALFTASSGAARRSLATPPSHCRAKTTKMSRHRADWRRRYSSSVSSLRSGASNGSTSWSVASSATDAASAAERCRGSWSGGWAPRLCSSCALLTPWSSAPLAWSKHRRASQTNSRFPFASGIPRTSDETQGIPRSRASITMSGQHSCQSDGASSTRVCRKIRSTSSSGGSTVMLAYLPSALRESRSVHPVGTAAKSTCGMRRARARSTLSPLAGHGLTRVTKRCSGSHGRIGGGNLSASARPPVASKPGASDAPVVSRRWK
eukprot:scaffold396_cov127-Isochrysis_galbana.AAC.10